MVVTNGWRGISAGPADGQLRLWGMILQIV